ncbi:MAG TPA: aldose epimerase family protein [Chitinophagaceae bacterium]|jgi:aldose 1-epimerase|nr:aldose epimerase family protein [Chitinophagaceae bacterium]
MRKTHLILLACLLFAMACTNNASNDPSLKDSTEQRIESTKAGIMEKSFGNYDNQPVTEFTLTNAAGMRVSILNYGGTVTKLLVPDRNGNLGDVVFGFDSFDGYIQKNNPFFGSLVGRYANRIANGKFTLDGKTYTLAGNDHGNSLHGGNKGYDKVMWASEKLSDSSLKLTYQSKDGEEGYPGNLTAQVIYTLGSDNSLKLDYTATTDKPTPINLTSHCYFNLSAGRDSTILNHQLQIDADKFTPVNDKLIPTGKIADVKGTPMDFTISKSIGRDIQNVKGGYDHNWVLNRNGNGLEKVVTLYDSTSGRLMEVFTTEPGIQFYSGNFLNGTLSHTKNGQKYVQHGALCLEAQHYPDSPNEPAFPNTILKPGETYKQTTVYKFSMK